MYELVSIVKIGNYPDYMNAMPAQGHNFQALTKRTISSTMFCRRVANPSAVRPAVLKIIPKVY